MTGGDPPPSSSAIDGEFLLRLLQNRNYQQQLHHHQQQQQPPPTHNLSLDPAVAAVGPSLPIPFSHQNHRRHPSLSPPTQNPNFFQQQQQPPWPHHLSPSHHQTPPSFAPHQHFRQQPPPPSSGNVMFGNIPFSHSSSSATFSHVHVQHNNNNNNDNNNNNNNININKKSNMKDSNFEQNFDLFKERELGFDLGSNMRNGFDPNRGIDPRLNWGQAHDSPPEPRRSGPPPGFSGGNSNQRRNLEGLYNVGRDMSSSSGELSSHFRGLGGSNGRDYDRDRGFSSRDNGVGGQLDHPGLPAVGAHHSVSGLDVEQSLKVLHGGGVDNGVSQDEVDELSERLVHSVLDEDPSDEKGELSDKKKHPRDKEFRSDARGRWILPQRTRISKRLIECRRDIHRLSAPFLALFETLTPPEEEKIKQKQLMTLLERLVCKKWPNAKLYVYGSCANSFGVSKSDIDVCLAINDQDVNKSEILLKLADILESENFQNVQALTRARVPIVKLMDPVTEISCDICINNVLAVVNTKLLRDYAEVDVRLRQLAFLVKHWAKSRGVNETYQGTLSSYAYVLMCIHFLQMRNPPILPCLQGMKATYAVTVDDIECAFFDQVEKLHNFGAQNRESIAQLMWGFFSYWAYCHDYTNTVISVRTASILGKHEKDWTRRVGNDRHLICIEDPFEVTHDLGRVVDKNSIRVLREEFERAAWIMQYDSNPCVTLFEPYVPPSY